MVGNPDHSRRLRRVHRSVKGHQTNVAVSCSTHYSGFDPDRWWNSPDSGIRTEIMESEKLLLDIVRHPIS